MNIKEEFKTVGFFYLMTAIYWIAIGFMAPYWILYLSSLKLSFSQIALLLATYPISSLIFEIPTGAVADLFGRKFSVFLSYLLTGVAFVGVLLSKANFPWLLIFYFLAGISFTLESGALEAWFIDTVEEKGKSKYLHRLLGRWGSLSAVGFIVGPFLGALMVSQGVEKPFWATAISMLFLSLFVFIFGKEIRIKASKPKIFYTFKDTLMTGKEGFSFVYKHPVVAVLSLAMATLAVSQTISYNAYQTYTTTQVGLSPYLLGFALSLSGLIAVISLNASDKIKKLVGGNKNILIIATFLFGTLILAVGLIRYIPLLFISLVGVASIWEFAGQSSPAYRELFNKFVPSKIRATAISANSFNLKLGELFGLFALGLISDHLGLQAAIVLAGVLVIAPTVLYFKIADAERYLK